MFVGGISIGVCAIAGLGVQVTGAGVVGVRLVGILAVAYRPAAGDPACLGSSQQVQFMPWTLPIKII
jgi:hypothetical protein